MAEAFGIVGGVLGLLTLLVTWGRERSRQNFDVTRSFGKKMLERIEVLEKRERELGGREDTLRLKLDEVETKQGEWERRYALLERDHNVLREAYEIMQGRVRNLEQEKELLQRSNTALHAELMSLYKQLGIRHTLPPPPTPIAKLQVIEEDATRGRKG